MSIHAKSTSPTAKDHPRSARAYYALLACFAAACAADSGSSITRNENGATPAENGGTAGASAVSTGGDPNSATSSGGSNIVIPVSGASSVASGGNGGQSQPGPYVLPDGFTKGEYGGYKLGAPFDGDKAPSGLTQNDNDCGGSILGVVRDFKLSTTASGHADFEAFNCTAVTRGLVEALLGSDQKPRYTGACDAGGGNCPCGQQTTGKANFDEWYRYTAGVSKPYVIYFSLAPNNGVLTFQSHTYFPLDDQGWGNEGQGHNFAFTTEIHTEFSYSGGESLSFLGDDDVWVFVNNHLAVDLGGLHKELKGSVSLDSVASSFGLERGNNYPLDLFHAERHSTDSNFRIDTNMKFTNCGVIVAEPPPR